MNRWMAAGLLLLANVLWGTSYAVAKVAMIQLPSPLLGALRFSIATAMLWLILLFQRMRGHRAVKIARADTLRLIGLGVLGIAVNHLITNFGQNLTTATDASLMIVGEVIFTTLLGAWILKERTGRWKQLGVLTGAVGAVVLILNGADLGAGTAGLRRAGGDLLILLGLPMEGLYSIVGTLFARRYPRINVAALVNTGSLLIWVPVLAWYMGTGRFPYGAWTALAGVAYLAVVNSVICYLLWFYVLERAGANFGAISLFAQPLVGATLGVAVLGDQVTPGLLLGGCLILAAVGCSMVPSNVDNPSKSGLQVRETAANE